MTPTGSGGPGCGARGWRRGLAELRADAPSHTSVHQDRLVWWAPEGPAAVPVGGGGAWPGFETTRRAKLAARTTRGRAAAHRHTQRPGPPAPGTPAAPQATPSLGRAAAHGAARPHSAPGTPVGPQATRENRSGDTIATTRENKNRRSRRICGFIVREGGVEPPLHHWNTDLNRARLPIPPLARTQKE